MQFKIMQPFASGFQDKGRKVDASSVYVRKEKKQPRESEKKKRGTHVSCANLCRKASLRVDFITRLIYLVLFVV